MTTTMPPYIDLRSDTVTRPTAAMRDAMAAAVAGDDMYGDDPTVNKLEAIAADMLGMQAAMFVPSGTQSNLCALLSHCRRGDEYIAGYTAHTYLYESGGAAVLGGIQPQIVPFQDDGTLDLDAVAAVIKPDEVHYARTRLLCLENTQNGKVIPLDYLQRARELTNQHGLSLHLDRARVFNAAAALKMPVVEIAKLFDSVSICLSKGLCAPVSSVLCGSDALVTEARRWRKMLGGGMRQAGVIAAAGILALTDQAPLLAQDHEKAQQLASALNAIPEIHIDPAHINTNMVFATLIRGSVEDFVGNARDEGILLGLVGDTVRFVTHYDFRAENIGRVTDKFRRILDAP